MVIEKIKKYWTKDKFGRWYESTTKPLYTLDDLPNGFSRYCPMCNEQMLYRFRDMYDFELQNKIPCKKCQQKKETPTRKCPKCNKELFYINKYVYQNAVKKNGICNSCSKRKSIVS